MIHHLLRKLGTVGLLIVLVGSVAGGIVPRAEAAPAAQAGPTTWTVLVGGQAEVTQQPEGPAGAWQFMRYYPGTITINVGDTIVWKLASAEPHTVTFPNPGENKAPDLIIPEGGSSQRMLMNPLAVLPQGGAEYDGSALTGSGQIGGGPPFPNEYKLTFTKAGTYDYYCAFHGMMKGTVVVQEAGTAYPKTQAQIDSDAAAQLAADTQAAKQAEPTAMQTSTRPGPNGTTIYEVNLGYGDGLMSWMRFSPADLTIHAGDTVEWKAVDVEAPHTVTFTSGGQEPELVLTEPQQAGPPKLVANPEVLNPAGGSTYSGQGYFNSGFIWGTQAPFPGPRTYSLTFDTPGTYPYICVLHDPLGMVGQITVLAQGAAAPQGAAPAQLPTTGGGSGPSGALWYIVAGLAVLVAGVLVWLLLRRQPMTR
jgi:plastocyanin